MVMKFKGRELPVSVYKFILADDISARFEEIKNKMKINGNETLALIVNIAHNLMKVKEQSEKEIKELNATSKQE